MKKIVVCLALVFCLSFNTFAQNQQRERYNQPSAKVTITLQEEFFAVFFESLFTNLGSPTYPLSKNETTEKNGDVAFVNASDQNNPQSAIRNPQSSCPSIVRLEREKMGVKTAVKFQNGKIVLPLAFSGDYNAGFVGCINFQGWADTVVNLQFDQQAQILKARVDVKEIHLDNVPSLANGVVVKLVQKQLDQKINPVEILKAEQVSANLPIKNTGALRLKAKEVRPEITQGSLQIHIFYEIVKA